MQDKNKNKYTLIVTSEKETDDPEKFTKTCSLSYFTDHPWEGNLEAVLTGSDADSLICCDNYSYEGLFYQLYENKNGTRIGFGQIDYDVIADDIKNYEFQNPVKRLLSLPKDDKFMQYMCENKYFAIGNFEFEYCDKDDSVTIRSGKFSRTFSCVTSLEDIISEFDLPLRICNGCGMPMTAGFTDEHSDTYFCCYTEFAADMDKRYGKGNWRDDIKNYEFQNPVKRLSSLPKDDKFIQYMCENKYLAIGNFEFEYCDEDDSVTIRSGKFSMTFSCITSLEDIISESDLPLRICNGCGMPMTAGFTDEYGETYFCCYTEFAADMDKRYGKGNWRETEDPDAHHCYEYRDENGEWVSEPSYHTEWEYDFNAFK